MNCQNCGGKYNDSNRYCPYCKAENIDVAVRLKKTALKNLDKQYQEEKERLEKEIPQKLVTKGTKITVMVIGILLGVIITGVLFVLILQELGEKVGQKGMEQHKETLEKYFESGDYERMSSYLRDKGMYDISLKKYEEVAEIYDDYSYWIIDMSEGWQKYIREERGKENPQAGLYQLEYMLEYSGQVLESCDEWCNDISFRGNEQVLAQFSKQTEELLKNTYFVTQEEIEFLRKSDLTQEETERLANSIMQRYLDAGTE